MCDAYASISQYLLYHQAIILYLLSLTIRDLGSLQKCIQHFHPVKSDSEETNAPGSHWPLRIHALIHMVTKVDDFMNSTLIVYVLKYSFQLRKGFRVYDLFSQPGIYRYPISSAECVCLPLPNFGCASTLH